MAESDMKGRILMVLCQHNMKLVQFNLVNNKERALCCIVVSVFNLEFFFFVQKVAEDGGTPGEKKSSQQNKISTLENELELRFVQWPSRDPVTKRGV